MRILSGLWKLSVTERCPYRDFQLYMVSSKRLVFTPENCVGAPFLGLVKFIY